MHIRSFIGAALMGLAMLAFAPAAMADPQPDICILDLSPSIAVDYALDAAPAVPYAAMTATMPAVLPFGHISGDQGEAAWPIAALTPHELDITGARLHFDPGRVPA